MKFLLILALVAVVSVEGSEVVPDQLDDSEPEQANKLEINGYEEVIISDGLNSVIERAGCTRASILCTLAGGKCIRHGDDCEGTYDPTGCKGSRCACCSPLPKKCSACPIEEGFFMYSGQCLKLFKGPGFPMNWFAANDTCASNGLVMAHPYDALGLRSYLVQRFGWMSFCWLNARGDGKYMRWLDNGEAIKEDNPLWSTPPPANASSDFCLNMWATEKEWNKERYTTYGAIYCSPAIMYPLCELKLE